MDPLAATNREKEEEKERLAKEAAEKTDGMYNPHGKSLRELLGDPKAKRRQHPKVPVVIDPRLTKVLRPHQVEGVKVRFFVPWDVHHTEAFTSFCTGAPPE